MFWFFETVRLALQLKTENGFNFSTGTVLAFYKKMVMVNELQKNGQLYSTVRSAVISKKEITVLFNTVRIALF